jgi:hypothetical protein
MTSSVHAHEETPDRQFRSWGETQIGRMLDHYAIPYFYEHPVAVIDCGKTRIWYPDFQLRDYGILIEYCGLLLDPHYAAGMARKEAVYRENGLAALMLTPDVFRGDWPGKILDRIEGVVSDRLIAFHHERRPSSHDDRGC